MTIAKLAALVALSTTCAASESANEPIPVRDSSSNQIGERATITILDSIFGKAIGALARDKTASGLTETCKYLQVLDGDARDLLAEPHKTTYLTASVHCLMRELGRTDTVTEAKILIPVTLWICEHGTEDLRKVMNSCDEDRVAELKARWRDLTKLTGLDAAQDEPVSAGTPTAP